LAAAILGGVDQIHMPPGSKVLYLGAASGTTVSHVSDVVGPVICLLLIINCWDAPLLRFFHYRKGWSMQWNFLIVLVVI